MDNQSQPGQTLQEEEYHFQEFTASEGGATNPMPSTASSSTLFERIKRKHIFRFLLVLLLVWGSYQLLARIFLKPPHHADQSLLPSAVVPVVSVPATLQQKKQDIIDDRQTASEVSIAKQSMTNIAGPTAPLVTEQPQLSVLEDRLKQLQEDFDRLSFQVRALQNSLGVLDSRFSHFSELIQPISQWHQQQMEKLAQQKQQLEKQKSAPKPLYHLYGVYAKRAWLVAQDGEILTLSLGDHLPGYGTVQLIDEAQSIVRFSSGAVVGLSPNGS